MQVIAATSASLRNVECGATSLRFSTRGQYERFKSEIVSLAFDQPDRARRLLSRLGGMVLTVPGFEHGIPSPSGAAYNDIAIAVSAALEDVDPGGQEPPLVR